jgi:hypothetical protein
VKERIKSESAGKIKCILAKHIGKLKGVLHKYKRRACEYYATRFSCEFSDIRDILGIWNNQQYPTLHTDFRCPSRGLRTPLMPSLLDVLMRSPRCPRVSCVTNGEIKDSPSLISSKFVGAQAALGHELKILKVDFAFCANELRTVTMH